MPFFCSRYGDYTDIIAPNRFRQKIADFPAVPRRYLAVLYQNGYLRVFGSGYHSGDILCEDVRGIELEGEELIAYLEEIRWWNWDADKIFRNMDANLEALDVPVTALELNRFCHTTASVHCGMMYGKIKMELRYFLHARSVRVIKNANSPP